jgi:hypothetical protein
VISWFPKIAFKFNLYHYTKVLQDDPDDVKALWRRSVSKLATHEYADAREDLRRVAVGAVQVGSRFYP